MISTPGGGDASAGVISAVGEGVVRVCVSAGGGAGVDVGAAGVTRDGVLQPAIVSPSSLRVLELVP